MIFLRNIRPLTDFKRNTASFRRRLRASGEPEVLTIDGKAELVVQDAAAYQRLLDALDEADAIRAIKAGLADVKAGRVRSVDDSERAFRRRHGLSKRAEAMAYRVEITARAEADIDRAYLWLHERSASAALTWYEGLMVAIRSLGGFPLRCPPAREGERIGVGVRCLLHGDYRVIFVVQRRRVRILHVRHGRRRPVEPGEL